ncbi:MAG: restriction endonuclease [Thermoleophilia bacterium]
MAAGHVEWLRLVEVSGPFLSVRVLGEAFPQGLDAVEPELVKELETALSEWDAAARDDPSVHRAFIRFLLERVLGYDAADLHDEPGRIARATAALPEFGVTLAPDYVIARPDDSPALLVVVAPAGAPLERPFTDRRLSASHAERMRLLLRGAPGATSGLLLNGESAMLVHAPGERSATFATFDVALMPEEPATLRAFASLAGARRVIAQDADNSLDGLLARSADDEREVTDALGDQARRAVEQLVAAIDADDRDSGGLVLTGVEPPTLYEAAVACVMRLIFLLAAEAQGLMPEEEAWTESYAVTPMRARLQEARERHTADVAALRMDAWPRLLATFRAVHGGLEHDRIRLPGYGGGLFDPGRYPFLEGTPDRPVRVSNAAVFAVLDDLQTLEVAVPGGGRERRPLSFRALGVEQIGHVYERLLEHWAVRADEPALGLAGSGRKEPEVGLRDLEETRERGDPALLALLRELTGRSESALMTALARMPDALQLAGLRAACDNEDDLLDRVVPFAGLLREDSRGDPLVFLPGRVYVTERPGGRAFQSHYTPRALTEPIVEGALEPLVFEGPAEGWERAQWRLRPPSQLLALRICDIAVGSGAFLVAACRYLALRLVDSWDLHPAERPPELSSDTEDRELLARRLVAERCLYGVDKNPLALEIAKVSLWLTTLRRDRPFTFLDHALRSGDSLVGITDVVEIEALSMDPPLRWVSKAAREGIAAALRRVRDLRTGIAATDAVDLRQIEEKQAVLAEADGTVDGLRAAADLVVGASIAALDGRPADAHDLVEPYAADIAEALTEDDTGRRAAGLGRVRVRAGELLLAGRAPMQDDLRPFHWPVEFPEVFGANRAGFDAIVGNPPFLGGQGITGAFGTPYREHLVARVAGGTRGSADLCAYFFLRGAGLLAADGSLALLATNTIAQGDTREVGLAQLLDDGSVVVRAEPSRPWPGVANLEIAQVWLRQGQWEGARDLAGARVEAITSHLSRPRRVSGDPLRLAANAGRSFQGAIVLGLGFVLSPEEASALIERDARNREVLFPYLTGQDLQSRPDQSPSRWVINFFDWTEERAREYEEPFAIVERLVRPERARLTRAARRDR